MVIDPQKASGGLMEYFGVSGTTGLLAPLL